MRKHSIAANRHLLGLHLIPGGRCSPGYDGDHQVSLGFTRFYRELINGMWILDVNKKMDQLKLLKWSYWYFPIIDVKCLFLVCSKSRKHLKSKVISSAGLWACPLNANNSPCRALTPRTPPRDRWRWLVLWSCWPWRWRRWSRARCSTSCDRWPTAAATETHDREHHQLWQVAHGSGDWNTRQGTPPVVTGGPRQRWLKLKQTNLTFDLTLT